MVAVLGAALAVQTVRRSFPQTSGTLDLPGLTAEVTVVRDDHGVPQIYADTAEDLFFAQGFVQAQDRFYEMDVRRHVTSGRLSEMFGEATLETDKVVRTLGWRRTAEQELRQLDPQAVAYLEAFSAGVNAYLAGKSPGELSLEYTLLGIGGLDYRVELWTPADSVAWLKAMAWDLRGNMQDEIDRVAAATRLGPRQIAELYPPYPYDRHRPVLAGGAVVDGRFDPLAGVSVAPAAPRVRFGRAAQRSFAQVHEAMAAVPPLVGTGDGVGSNAWAVDGDHSTTGEPILANDPHLAPTMPGVWYQMGLHCTTVGEDCPFDVAGFTLSGFPGVVIGHNQQIAWGFTNLGADVTDLYLEAVKGERYLRDGRWRRFERRRESISVAGGEPFRFTVRTSVHGPLLSDVTPRFASVGANAPVPARKAPERGSGYAVALSWTALQPSLTAQAIFAIDAATSWEEFRDAARDFAAPSQNLVYADRDGHIGYQAPGLIPVRRPANDGLYPSPGWDPAYDWTGRHVPFDQLPSQLDPPEGFIASANQAPVGPSYVPYLGQSYDRGYRSQRIVELLTKKGKLSLADMSEIQLDTRNGFAPTLVPYLLEVDPGSRYYAAGQRLLEGWDHTQPADSAAAAYYNAVWRNLLELTFSDQLPESVEVEGDDRWWEVVGRLLVEPGSPWWDDLGTDTVREGRDDILRQALRDARDELVRLQSRRPDGWTWGHQHRLTLRNQTLGQSGAPLVARLVNRGPWELGGGTDAVNALGWKAGQGYEVTWVPSMRMVVSLADLDASTWVNLTGASGHAFSRHYTDQTDLWAKGRTLPWPFTRPAVDEAAEDVLTLVPREE